MSSLLPNAKQTFINPTTGLPLVGGSVFYYVPNTTTQKATYQDQAQTIPNANPITLDASGSCIAWGSGSYRQVVYDVNGNLIWDQVTADVSQATQTAQQNLIVATQSAQVISAVLPVPPSAISSWYQISLVAPAASVAGVQLMIPNAPSPWNTALPIMWNGAPVIVGLWGVNDALYVVWNPAENAWDLTTIGSRSAQAFIDSEIAAQLASGKLPASVTTLAVAQTASVASLAVAQNATISGNTSMTGTLSVAGTCTVPASSATGQAAQWDQVPGLNAPVAVSGRALDTTYTNTSARPLNVMVNVYAPAGSSPNAVVSGVSVMGLSIQGGFHGNLAFIVPPGGSYRVNSVGATLDANGWVEYK